MMGVCSQGIQSSVSVLLDEDPVDDSGNLTQFTCGNCGTFVALYLNRSQKYLLNHDHMLNGEDISKLKNTKDYSEIFKIIPLTPLIGDGYNVNQLPVLKTLQLHMQKHLTSEKNKMEERIKQFAHKQRVSYLDMFNKAQADRSTLFTSISQHISHRDSGVRKSRRFPSLSDLTCPSPLSNASTNATLLSYFDEITQKEAAPSNPVVAAPPVTQAAPVVQPTITKPEPKSPSTTNKRTFPTKSLRTKMKNKLASLANIMTAPNQSQELGTELSQSMPIGISSPMGPNDQTNLFNRKNAPVVVRRKVSAGVEDYLIKQSRYNERIRNTYTPDPVFSFDEDVESPVTPSVQDVEEEEQEEEVEEERERLPLHNKQIYASSVPVNIIPREPYQPDQYVFMPNQEDDEESRPITSGQLIQEEKKVEEQVENSEEDEEREDVPRRRDRRFVKRRDEDDIFDQQQGSYIERYMSFRDDYFRK
ncbi:hypothetical protein AKO1_007882 [Acrasis kona]|uniref:Uncharacterized protein n=1 Tax=Acrasis kona TaxID=1008807 RepID=A0AAW2YPU2_9EUKA